MIMLAVRWLRNFMAVPNRTGLMNPLLDVNKSIMTDNNSDPYILRRNHNLRNDMDSHRYVDDNDRRLNYDHDSLDYKNHIYKVIQAFLIPSIPIIYMA